MKQPTEEDFKAHALVLCHQARSKTNLELLVAAMKFGYQLALRHSTDEVETAFKDLIASREKSNRPQ